MEQQADLPVVRIEAETRRGIIDLAELLHYRDLLYFMVWRGIKASYAQSIGGYAWAIIQPAIQVLVFSVIFGGLIGLDAQTTTPFVLLTTVAVIPWSYMSSSVGGTSNALVLNSGMLAKIYFPRVIFLLTPLFGNLVSFTVSLVLLVGVMLWFQVSLTLNMLVLPLFLLLMILTPLAIGLWLSSLAIRFRDVKIAMDSMLRMLIYLVPVMYPSESIPENLRQWYILNPFVGIIEGFQSALLGRPFMWDSGLAAIAITLVLLITGAIYFRRMERVIVDVI
jgi:lipopolysaccharide transport system permease protein